MPPSPVCALAMPARSPSPYLASLIAARLWRKCMTRMRERRQRSSWQMRRRTNWFAWRWNMPQKSARSKNQSRPALLACTGNPGGFSDDDIVIPGSSSRSDYSPCGQRLPVRDQGKQRPSIAAWWLRKITLLALTAASAEPLSVQFSNLFRQRLMLTFGSASASLLHCRNLCPDDRRTRRSKTHV